jgi:K+/H+ antiporter YhaU regulatory subunit KhtT
VTIEIIILLVVIVGMAILFFTEKLPIELTAFLGAQVVGIVRKGKRQLAPGADTVLHAQDVLLVEGHYDRVKELFGVHDIEIGDLSREALSHALGDVTCQSIHVDPDADLVGQNLKQLRFRELYGAVVIGIRREQAMFDGDLGAEPLRSGDELLALGTRSQFEDLDLPDGMTALFLDPGSLPDLLAHLFVLRIHAGSSLVGVRIRNSSSANSSGDGRGHRSRRSCRWVSPWSAPAPPCWPPRR